MYPIYKKAYTLGPYLLLVAWGCALFGKAEYGLLLIVRASRAQGKRSPMFQGGAHLGNLGARRNTDLSVFELYFRHLMLQLCWEHGTII